MSGFLLYLLGVPVVALLVCLMCTRHRPLLWLGGLLLVLAGCLSVLMFPPGHPGRDTHNDPVFGAILLPLLVAGASLVVAGLVRWGLAKRTR